MFTTFMNNSQLIGPNQQRFTQAARICISNEQYCVHMKNNQRKKPDDFLRAFQEQKSAPLNPL
jgi:hypothetical protein